MKVGAIMKVNESVENYLETILILTNRIKNVKSIDIVKELNFSKASVSIAMKNLRSKNLINIDREGYITLSETGFEIATLIYERHTLLPDWLTTLGVDSKIASEDACRIEHVISVESFDAIKKHLSLFKSMK